MGAPCQVALLDFLEFFTCPHPRYPSLPLEYPPYQGHAPARPELTYRTPPRNLLVQRAKGPQRPRRAVPMGRTRGHHVYAGRRGRRPLPCLTSCPYLRGRHVYAGRRPLPRPTHVYTPTPCPHPTSCRHHMVGRDVLGAPRPRDAHGDATCTRAAEDVGPYHASPMFTPPRPVRTPHPVHTHGRARRPRRAAPTGRPWNAHGNATCTRAAEDVGPYHASRPVHAPRPVHTHWRVTMSGGGLRISTVSVRSF